VSRAGAGDPAGQKWQGLGLRGFDGAGEAFEFGAALTQLVVQRFDVFSVRICAGGRQEVQEIFLRVPRGQYRAADDSGRAEVTRRTARADGHGVGGPVAARSRTISGTARINPTRGARLRPQSPHP
jgi:hypothetical protein